MQAGGFQVQINAINGNREPWSRGGFAIEEDDFKFREEQFEGQKGQPGRTAPLVEIQNWNADRVEYLERKF